jgi:hypothetical protein
VEKKLESFSLQENGTLENNRRTNMTNKLLGIIAINLTIITGLMVLQSIPTATAADDIQKVYICNSMYYCD